MKSLKSLLIVIFVLLLLSVSQVHLLAQQNIEKVPDVINFSGVVSGPDDNIVTDGKYTILFSLYTTPEGGDPVWTELHENVMVENGEINVQLGGASVPSPLNFPFNRPYFLGIKLNENSELTPRIELLPAPFSIRTLVANSVKDSSITSDKIAPNSVTDIKIKSVSWSKIKDIPEIDNNASKNQSPAKAAELPNYWRRYGNYLASGEEFLGTANDRDLVIKTDSVTRMVFDPYGRITMGTQTDSVFFEVIGKTTLADVYVKMKMGVGADFDETKAKVHIKTTGNEIPFRVDNNGQEAFVIEKTGRVEITSQVTGAEDEEDSYALFLNAEDQGIAVEVNGDDSNGDHNYMTFWDDDNESAGRIEGINMMEFMADPKTISHNVWFGLQVTALAVASSVAPLEPPDIVNGIAEVAYWTFQNAWDLSHLGVTYESGSGDYAEWLERLNPAEVFTPGEIVGVYGGKISRNTDNAEQIMSISLSPLVLGNMPPKDKVKYFEKVAFKGQVPVKVQGAVHKGDYIIPSGLNDGSGIAVEPGMMTIEEFTKVLGRAWEENPNEGLKLINVAVGLKMKELVNIIKQRHRNNQAVETTLVEKNKELDNILSQLNEVEQGVKLAKLRTIERSSGEKQKYTLNKK